MANDDILTDMLLKALSNEWAAKIIYEIHVSQFKTLGDEKTAEHLQEHADDEFGHAKDITEYLADKGITIIIDMTPIQSEGSKPISMLAHDMEEEIGATELYNQILLMCENKKGLKKLKELIEPIRDKEIEHQDDTAVMIREVMDNKEVGGEIKAAVLALFTRTAQLSDEMGMTGRADIFDDAVVEMSSP